MVLVQKWPFFQLFFLGNIGHKNVSYDILQRKNAFLAYKIKKFKKSKNSHFSKGVSPQFWSKNGDFFNLFQGNIGQENLFYDILEQKKTLFQTMKTRSSKSGKFDFFAKGLTDGFGLKMAIFPTFIFQEIQPRKMSFRIFQNKKTPLQAIKTKSSKSRKIDNFFNFFFLGNIRQENVFYDIVQRINTFLGYKNKKFKKSKN